MGGPCILVLVALIGLVIWFVALLRKSSSPRGDQSLARDVGKLARLITIDAGDPGWEFHMDP